MTTPADAPPLRIVRLGPADRDVARTLFTTMAAAFDEPAQPLGDAYLDRLLARGDFWAMAALAGDDVVGGLTAHTLPMTRAESTELFVFDVAVRTDQRRRGVGRRLIAALRAGAHAAGIGDVFVPADQDDDDARAFYAAIGGVAADVTMFTFPAPPTA